MLKFIETSGEQETYRLFHNRPAVINLLKESAQEAASKGPRRRGARQAPPLFVAVLEAIEEVVMDDSLPLFVRFYAWTGLVCHWSAMRWDDTVGLKPASLELRPRGLYGQLERTKTSGPGKHVSVFPIYVSRRAYVKCIIKNAHLLAEDPSKVFTECV